MGAAESSPQTKESYEVGEEQSKNSSIFALWTRLHACNRGKIRGTLFVKEFGGSSDSKKYFENGIKSLRQLRHPHILQYVDSLRMGDELKLITERVQVLDVCIDSLRNIEIRSGLRSILEALVFLHTTASMSHNALCPASIFVAQDGTWKLGGFEFARKTTGGPKEPDPADPSPTSDDHLLLSDFFRAVKPAPFSPPEDQQAMASDQPSWARDAYGLGKLIDYSLQYVIGEDEEVVQSLRDAAALLTRAQASDRPSLVDCLRLPAFSNPLSEIETFVRTIQTRTDEERDAFFDSLLPSLRALPPPVLARRLTRCLLSRYVLFDDRAHLHLLPSLLQPAAASSSPCPPSPDGGLLPVDLFRMVVLPECTHVLRVRDAGVRKAMLRHFDRFAPFYPVDELRSTVLGEIVLGLEEDEDSQLVAATLRAMAVLVPILGADTVLGRERTKDKPARRKRIFADGTPKTAPTISSESVVDRYCYSPVSLVSSKISSPSSQPSYKSVAATTPILPSTVLEPELEPIQWSQADESWNEGWEEDEESKEHTEIKEHPEIKDQVITKVPLEKKNSVAVDAKRNSSDIGAEFAVTVTVRNEIDDLFAEMQPEIKTAGSILSQLEELANKKRDEETVAVDGRGGVGGGAASAPVGRRLFEATEEIGVASAWGAEGELDLEDD